MLEKEFQYYLDHLLEIITKHNGKFVVIKDERVIGAYDTENEAYEKTIETNELGTFIIQQALPEDKQEKQVFHSRVHFV